MYIYKFGFLKILRFVLFSKFFFRLRERGLSYINLAQQKHVSSDNHATNKMRIFDLHMYIFLHDIYSTETTFYLR